MSTALAQELREGAVYEPYRAGPRILVVQVNVHIPARQQSFLEVRERVRQDFVQANAATLEEDWLNALAAEHQLEVFEENLTRFGARLMDAMSASPATPSASPAAASPP